MDNVLGLFLLVVFSVCVIVLAAGITWVVVKISPAKSKQPQSGT